MKRREFVNSLAVAPGVVIASAAPTALVQAAARPVVPNPAPLTPHPVASEAMELELAGGFRVVQSYDLFHGALPFVIEGEGARFQVDVLRRTEDGASGVFSTPSLTLFVHGAGGATQERGARALGLALERRFRASNAMPALASFEERGASANGAIFDVDFVGSAQSV